MLLVPRQLQRAGLTGDVPYYGGRFTPAQAYAAAHPRRPAPSPSTVPSRSPVPSPSPVASRSLAALRELLDAGVLSDAEYRRFRARVTG
jgi:hypothetical protein